ncbi:hypothetical protein Y032_0087g2015 [Ancylostoma ceylanicum]|uniref:Uncharacterized protein n=1 Tax=Ancylostoma ceylanicum TaxID=53326 RepID=A0A016TP86_9BILA|nr:hypothetical protein Y032_0087g2015 [Ancylostoma ceylanicum]
MKVNVMRNLIKTSERIATGVSDTDGTIQRILFGNGYSSGKMTTWRPYSAPDGLALAKRVHAIVKKSQLPVRLIFRPPPTLEEILTPLRLYEDGCDEEGCR